jgi:hypothetical protein
MEYAILHELRELLVRVKCILLMIRSLMQIQNKFFFFSQFLNYLIFFQRIYLIYICFQSLFLYYILFLNIFLLRKQYYFFFVNYFLINFLQKSNIYNKTINTQNFIGLKKYYLTNSFYFLNSLFFQKLIKILMNSGMKSRFMILISNIIFYFKIFYYKKIELFLCKFFFFFRLPVILMPKRRSGKLQYMPKPITFLRQIQVSFISLKRFFKGKKMLLFFDKLILEMLDLLVFHEGIIFTKLLNIVKQAVDMLPRYRVKQRRKRKKLFIHRSSRYFS